MDNEKLVDIDKIINEKAKNLPGFVQKIAANYLKRIAHQDQVNAEILKLLVDHWDTPYSSMSMTNGHVGFLLIKASALVKIGRASCRERV